MGSWIGLLTVRERKERERAVRWSPNATLSAIVAPLPAAFDAASGTPHAGSHQLYPLSSPGLLKISKQSRLLHNPSLAWSLELSKLWTVELHVVFSSLADCPIRSTARLPDTTWRLRVQQVELLRTWEEARHEIFELRQDVNVQTTNLSGLSLSASRQGLFGSYGVQGMRQFAVHVLLHPTRSRGGTRSLRTEGDAPSIPHRPQR